MSDDNVTPSDAPASDTPEAAPTATAVADEVAADATPSHSAETADAPSDVTEPSAVEGTAPPVEDEMAAPEPAAETAEPEVAERGDADAVGEPVAEAVPAAEAGEAPPAEPAPPESNKKWYVVKIQSGREESIKAAIERKVKIEGLEEFFGQIAIPVEEYNEKKSVRAKVKNKKTGEVETVTQERNVLKKKKKFPGYLFAEVEFNDRILYLFRETSGVGDFVGATGPMKPPPPMTDREVQQMLTGIAGPGDPKKPKKVAVKLDFEKGDKVRVKDGAFSGSEAEVKEIIMPKDPTDTPKVKVVVTIWGRPVEMEMDYWHVDKI